jgi:hypothetical protein
MHVWLNRLRFAFYILPVVLATSPSFATSVGKSVAPSPNACQSSARFVSTKLVGQKLFWVFEPLSSSSSTTIGCAKLAQTFEVFIPSGSFSNFSHSNVYPLSITEPKPGAEIDLRVEPVKMKTGETHWFLSGDDDAFRVRR